MTARSIAVASLVAVAAAAGGLAGSRLLRRAPTDEERVRRVFEDAARAAEERRVGDVMEAVSPRFRGEGVDRDGLRRFVAFHALRGSWSAAVVLGSSVRLDGGAAEATVDVALARGGGRPDLAAGRLPDDASLQRIDARLEREDGTFRVVSARWRPIGPAEALAGPPP
ncbi:MAG TPA: hypothetical protein VMT17_13390 [Anaeromyxobacteraceae bacterium]|nr:hypothetical protein [Anaeromyxobacteraceae bacterium]